MERVSALFLIILLVSCTPQPASPNAALPPPSATPVPPTIPAPTATAVPTIEVESLQLPDPHATDPDLFNLVDPHAPLVQYAHAFDIRTQDIGELHPVQKTGVDGQTIVFLVTQDGFPLIAARQEPAGSWKWERVTLSLLATAAGTRYGSEALDGGDDPARFELLHNEFDLLTVGSVSWMDTMPTEARLDLRLQKAYLAKAIQYGHPATFMHLVYGSPDEVPDWLRSGSYSREQLEKIIQDHITAVMSSLRNQVSAGSSDIELQYTVVNEAASNPALFWPQRLGLDYVPLAFQAARAADPKATLLYNDAGHELPDSLYVEAVFRLVERLQDEHLLDGVGMQMHMMGGDGPDPNLPIEVLENGIRAQIDRYAAIGVKVYITELDVDLNKISGSPREKMDKAAEIYRMIARISATHPNVVQVSTWGVNSESSWQNSIGGEGALLFRQDRPLPTYYATLKGLFESLK